MTLNLTSPDELRELPDPAGAALPDARRTGQRDMPAGAGHDFLGYREMLVPRERVRLEAAREMFESQVRPVVASHWTDASFPFELIPGLAKQNLVDVAATGASYLLQGLLQLELSRVDASVSTFLGVHSELVTAAVRRLGSDAQKATSFYPA